MTATGRIVAAVVLLALAGCGSFRESRVNPANWFGGRDEAPSLAPSDGYPDRADPRPLVGEIAALQVDRVPGGAIVRATAVPPSQGFWDAALVPEVADSEGNPVPEGGVMAFQFRATPPEGPAGGGSAASREITAGFFVTDQGLAGVRTITVRGQSNQRSARR